METFLIKALQLIVALLLLVTIHEFGHYIFARIFGVRVNRFYLFFNPWFSLLKYYPDKGQVQIIAWTKKVKEEVDGKEEVREEPKALLTFKAGKPHPKTKKPSWRDTLYGIGWVPLGGYCDIAGMIDETKSASDLESEPQPWEFRSKAAWKRLMVMVAGVLFNFILAIVIYAGIAFYWGDRVVPYQDAKEGMDFTEDMHKAGFADGDILLSINGKKADAKDDSQIWEMIQSGATVEVLRGIDTVTVKVPDGTLEKLAKSNTQFMAYRTPVLVEKTVNGEPAVKAGILAGDRIIKVATDTTPSLSEFYRALDAHKGKKVDMMVMRADSTITLPVQISGNGKIGIQLTPIDKIYPVEVIEYGFFASIPRGIEIGVDKLTTYVASLKLLFTKDGAQQVGGFGTIGSLFPDTWDWYSFWQITAFLSVILAFMNIIPIPGLDGGHVLFTLWEIITRRKPSEKFLEYANMVGMVFLLLLLVYANANDVIRAFFK